MSEKDLKKSIEEAELGELGEDELEEVAGGLGACGAGCKEACMPGCLPGGSKPAE